MTDVRTPSAPERPSVPPFVPGGPAGPLGRVCVLDLETAPDRHAAVLAGRRRGTPRDSILDEVIAASMLTFVEASPGVLEGFDLVSFHRDGYKEVDILLNVERELVRVLDEGGTLVTFNGRAFDLPTLRARQLRWWLCGLDAVPRIAAGEVDHVDVMLETSLSGAGRWPTLADACASVGFALWGPVDARGGPRPPPEVEKCERDVVGTAMLFLYVLAGRRRSAEPLGRGLPALGCYLKDVGARRPHLERFALNAMLQGRGAWGA